MKRVLFKRILVSYLIIAPILFIALEIYLSSVIKDTYSSNIREGLIIQSRLISGRIPSLSINLDAFCREYREKTGARITIVDRAGRVVGDSDEPSGGMDNHGDRPEIAEASLSGVGSSIRFSATLRKNLYYLAVAVDSGGEKGFLRLSIPLQDMEESIARVRRRILLASLTALLAAIMVGLLQTGRITKSIGEIAAFSKEVASGNFRKRLFLEEGGELGELGKNISDMAQESSARLRESEEEKNRMEAILRSLSDGLMLVDAKGAILLCNEAVKGFFRLETDIEGKTMGDVLRNAELMELVGAAIRRGESLAHEIAIFHPRELYLMATAAPFYSDLSKTRISGAILTLHDITRLRQLEEMRKDFVANVSHEIKTPITAIKGFAETLLEGALDDRENARKFLETIKNHSERLNSLVSDLLILSRIEMGDIVIEKRPVDVESVIDSVFTTLRDKAKAKGLYLNKAFPAEVPALYADRDRFTQILLNLVDNGIKFTDYGGVTVGIEKTEGKTVFFAEDTGIGIAKRHLPRLGERFYRVDRARSRELGGTGLGLAIVKHLVKAHGWDMAIESVQGKGTKVKITAADNEAS